MMPHSWRARLTTTLAAWLVAFLTVMSLLTFLGDELASLPLALRALVISGLMVFLMGNLVMPILIPTVARLLPDEPPDRRGSTRGPAGETRG